MLTYSRDADLDFQLTPLKPMVVEALNLARDKTIVRLTDQNVRESVTVPDQITLETCRPRIVQAMTNVISNAFEALEQKGDGAMLEIVATPNGTDSVLLIVKDTGCGMEPSQVEDAKKRFRSLKKEQGGIGLGLPLAIKIVQREHGGRLEIESEIGVGTTVTIELPVAHDTEE